MKYLSAAIVCSILAGRSVFAAEASPLQKLIDRATKGDPAAQITLAFDYRDGSGVEKDSAEAMHWAHLAADQGNAQAMDFLGFAYLTGQGTQRNTKLAFGYFHAASEGNSARGAFNLGQCYFGAQGIEQDIPKALAAWKHAADLGEGRAAAEAAMVYLSGEGVRPDPAQARALAARAAELNDPSGMVVLGEIQFQTGQFDDARANWQKAASLHHTGETGEPTQPSDDMSAQEGADLLKLMDYRHRKGEPGTFGYVESQHVHQGFNNCGATATTMLARFQGATIGAWAFKRLCPSPIGTGTDWNDLIAAAGKIGLHWKLVTFAADDPGFEQGTAFLKSEIDAGRPVAIDFMYTGPQYPNGFAGHTLDVAGYIASENLYILKNPAIASPGLELMTATDLKKYWHSAYYTSAAHGVMSRPAIVVEGKSDK